MAPVSSVKNIRIWIAPIFAVLGSGMILPSVLGSRSASPVLFGRYSFGLAVFLMVLLMAVVVSVGLLLRIQRFKRFSSVAGSLPDGIAVVLLAIPFPVVFFTWIFPYFTIFERWNVVVGLLLVFLFPGMLCLESRERIRRRNVLCNYLVFTSSCMVFLIIGEYTVRLLTPGPLYSPVFGLVPYSRHIIMVDIPGVSFGGTLTTNRLGLRGEDPPANWESYTTILTIGGSTTHNTFLDDSKTWSHVLEETLRSHIPLVWVGNAGIPMHSTEQHYHFLREVASEIQPDIAIFLVGINDLGKTAARFPASIIEDPLRETLLSNSRLLQIIYKVKRVHIDGARVISLDSPYLSEFDPIPLSEEEQPFAQWMDKFSPEIVSYSRNIERLINTCREMGITPLFLTQPLLFEDNDYWRGISGGCYWFGDIGMSMSAATRRRLLDMYNQALVLVCQRQGVACFDLASKISGDSRYFYDMMHFTENGARRVGSLLGKFILSSGMLSQEPILW